MTLDAQRFAGKLYEPVVVRNILFVSAGALHACKPFPVMPGQVVVERGEFFAVLLFRVCFRLKRPTGRSVISGRPLQCVVMSLRVLLASRTGAGRIPVIMARRDYVEHITARGAHTGSYSSGWIQFLGM